MADQANGIHHETFSRAHVNVPRLQTKSPIFITIKPPLE